MTNIIVHKAMSHALGFSITLTRRWYRDEGKVTIYSNDNGKICLRTKGFLEKNLDKGTVLDFLRQGDDSSWEVWEEFLYYIEGYAEGYSKATEEFDRACQDCTYELKFAEE